MSTRSDLAVIFQDQNRTAPIGLPCADLIRMSLTQAPARQHAQLSGRAGCESV